MGEVLLHEITFNLPKLSVWDIITCVDKPREEYESDKFFQLCIAPLSKSANASEIIEHMSSIILEKRHLDEIGNLSFDGESFARSTLKVNLYCVLLLEAMRQTLPDVKPKILNEFIDDRIKRLEDSSTGHTDYEEISRMLSKRFPAILKELFAISKKESDGKYQIRTRYPELLFPMLRFCRNMPLVDSERSSYSFERGSIFYKECIHSISQCDHPEVSLAEYYLFERLFRLNAKISLFKAEYSCLEKKESLSPRLLANCLFPLPLVLFPENNLTDLLYGDWSEAGESIIPKTSQEISSRQSLVLSFLIRLSFNFRDTLYILRKILNERNYHSPEEITSFFFPGGNDEVKEYIESVRPEETPTLGEPYRAQKVRTYNEDWKTFIPSVIRPSSIGIEEEAYIGFRDKFAKALEFKEREEWYWKPANLYRRPIDQIALECIQKNI